MYIPGLVSIIFWALVAPITAILYSTYFIKKKFPAKRELQNICLALYFLLLCPSIVTNSSLIFGD